MTRSRNQPSWQEEEEAYAKEVTRAIDAAAGPAVDRRRIVEILIQRRLLSINMFTWMLDNLICAMDDDEVREIAIGILRDEYAGPNHRYEFLKEIAGLGIPRRDVLQCKPTSVTRKVMKAIAAKTVELIDGTDLERVAFLRFFAEILPGQEFARLLEIMEEQGMLHPDRSVFLRPHVGYDVVGVKGHPSHAEQYRDHIDRLIAAGGDRSAVSSSSARHAT